MSQRSSYGSGSSCPAGCDPKGPVTFWNAPPQRHVFAWNRLNPCKTKTMLENESSRDIALVHLLFLQIAQMASPLLPGPTGYKGASMLGVERDANTPTQNLAVAHRTTV